MRVIMVDEAGGVVFNGDNSLLKSHVQAYTRSDGTFVKEHDDKRQKKLGDNNPFGNHPHVVGKISSHKVAGDGGRGYKDGNGDPTHPSTTSIGFAGKDYKPTGKTGSSLHDQTPVHEFEHEDSGHRVWADASGNVHADGSDEVERLRSEYEKHTGGGESDAGGKSDDVSDSDVELMESSLSNDEESSDDELVEHFIENGVSAKTAWAAVKFRDKFLSGAMESGSLKELLAGTGEGKDLAAGLKKPEKSDSPELKAAKEIHQNLLYGSVNPSAQDIPSHINSVMNEHGATNRKEVEDHIRKMGYTGSLGNASGSGAADKKVLFTKPSGEKPATKPAGKYGSDGDREPSAPSDGGKKPGPGRGNPRQADPEGTRKAGEALRNLIANGGAKKLTTAQVNKLTDKHEDKMVRKGAEWDHNGYEGKKIPAADVENVPSFTHKEVYGHNGKTSPEGDDFTKEFAAKGHQGFVLQHPNGKKSFVDTQGYNYARYHGPVGD